MGIFIWIYTLKMYKIIQNKTFLHITLYGISAQTTKFGNLSILAGKHKHFEIMTFKINLIYKLFSNWKKKIIFDTYPPLAWKKYNIVINKNIVFSIHTYALPGLGFWRLANSFFFSRFWNSLPPPTSKNDATSLTIVRSGQRSWLKLHVNI